MEKLLDEIYRANPSQDTEQDERDLLRLAIAIHGLKLHRLGETERRARFSPFLSRRPGRVRNSEFVVSWRQRTD